MSGSPPEVLAAELAAWRTQPYGRSMPFAPAWARSVEVALRGAAERDSWRVAFAETEDAWRRAYDREPPTRAERALSTVADGLELSELVEQRCERCDRPLGDRGAGQFGERVRFCSDRCRREASRVALSHSRTALEQPEASAVRRGATMFATVT